MTRFSRTRAKTSRARELRCTAPKPEQRLWFHLRGSQMHGFAFRRQHPVGPYILDFYCPAAKLAVELDGEQHATATARAHDAARTRFLESQSIRVLRFWNHELKESFDGVLEAIDRALTPTRAASPRDLPLSGGGNSNLNL